MAPVVFFPPLGPKSFERVLPLKHAAIIPHNVKFSCISAYFSQLFSISADAKSPPFSHPIRLGYHPDNPFWPIMPRSCSATPGHLPPPPPVSPALNLTQPQPTKPRGQGPTTRPWGHDVYPPKPFCTYLGQRRPLRRPQDLGMTGGGRGGCAQARASDEQKDTQHTQHNPLGGHGSWLTKHCLGTWIIVLFIFFFALSFAGSLTQSFTHLFSDSFIHPFVNPPSSPWGRGGGC